MKSSLIEVAVIGGGHAGLTMSYYLKRNNLDHIVFEKGRIGNTWLTQRWDDFRLNTPNKVNQLPGLEDPYTDNEGFASAPEFVTCLERYSAKFQLPVVDNSEILSVGKGILSKGFSINVIQNGSQKNYHCRYIVIASGAQNRKIIPSFAGNISKDILQLHSSEYRNPALLPDGAVLVIGGAQSGVQIAENLVDNGKKVFLSTSRVGRVPRRYRGRDIVEWLIDTGFYDIRTDELSDRSSLTMRFPQISGVGYRGHTVSLQSLSKKGVTILGKAHGAENRSVCFHPDVAANIQFADESSKNIKIMIDRHIEKSRLITQSSGEDPNDVPDERAACGSTISSIDLLKNKISSIIWTTGFEGDFSYLRLPFKISVNSGVYQPGSNNGMEDVYFLGLPWLRKRKSGIILGASEDAEIILNKLLAIRGKVPLPRERDLG